MKWAYYIDAPGIGDAVKAAVVEGVTVVVVVLRFHVARTRTAAVAVRAEPVARRAVVGGRAGERRQRPARREAGIARRLVAREPRQAQQPSVAVPADWMGA